MIKRIQFYSILILATVAIASCASNPKSTTTTDAQTEKPVNKWKPPITGTRLDQYTAYPKRLIVFNTKLGVIKAQMFEKIAPKHVAHFMQLAKSGFWAGTTFHRVIPGFMIQGGDPNSKDNDLLNDGTGQPGLETVPAEFSSIHHEPGILSTARRGDDVNSATSQFFIMVADYGSLDRQYTVWGQVVEGMDVVNQIVALPDVTKRDPGEVRRGGANPGKASEILSVSIEGE